MPFREEQLVRAFWIMLLCLTTRGSSSSFLGASRRVRSSRHVLWLSTSETTSKSKALSVPTILLKRTRQSKAFRNGNQLVFSRAIQSILPPTANASSALPQVASLVQVAVQAEHHAVVLGWGVYNPHSLYRVRMLCHKFLQPDLHQKVLEESNNNNNATAAVAAMIRHHVRTAVALRTDALQLPNADTDTYRLVNGEGDGLSGLAVDILAHPRAAVVMSSALWCQAHRSTICNVLQECLPVESVVWKTTPARLEQDGASQVVESADGNTDNWLQELQPQEHDSNIDDDRRQVLAKENGIMFATYPFVVKGQKTGVYCDQRENRWHVATLAKNKRVLDLCCYHGGFSLTAVVRGGAVAAVGVDSSPDAIATCRLNAQLNECTDKVDFVRADISDFLRDQYQQQEEYDIVVLDPPKLAPSEKALDKARRKYHGLNRDAIKVVSNSGGLLMTCTCSAAMTRKDGGQYFLNMVQGAALAAGRSVTLLRVSGAASCHTQSPIAWPASSYLTAALFYVHPV